MRNCVILVDNCVSNLHCHCTEMCVKTMMLVIKQIYVIKYTVTVREVWHGHFVQ